VSCTDDKTACPCEPTPAFTAEDVKKYVLELGGSNEGWYPIENGMYVPNENYNPEHAAEDSRLYREWLDNRGVTRRDSYDAWLVFRHAHEATVNQEKVVPFVFKHDGVEYPVTIVEDNGGSEGHGEYCHMIYEIDGRYFKLEGSYYSYDGMYWDDDSFREVKAATKEVMVYE
jgi:hypothetical protein